MLWYIVGSIFGALFIWKFSKLSFWNSMIIGTLTVLFFGFLLGPVNFALIGYLFLFLGFDKSPQIGVIIGIGWVSIVSVESSIFLLTIRKPLKRFKEKYSSSLKKDNRRNYSEVTPKIDPSKFDQEEIECYFPPEKANNSSQKKSLETTKDTANDEVVSNKNTLQILLPVFIGIGIFTIVISAAIFGTSSFRIPTPSIAYQESTVLSTPTIERITATTEPSEVTIEDAIQAFPSAEFIANSFSQDNEEIASNVNKQARNLAIPEPYFWEFYAVSKDVRIDDIRSHYVSQANGFKTGIDSQDPKGIYLLTLKNDQKKLAIQLWPSTKGNNKGLMVIYSGMSLEKISKGNSITNNDVDIDSATDPANEGQPREEKTQVPTFPVGHAMLTKMPAGTPHPASTGCLYGYDNNSLLCRYAASRTQTAKAK